MLNRNQTYPALLALWVASVIGASTPGFAASNTVSSAQRYAMSDEVLSDRSCKRGPKQEICDWVKRDHKTATGH